MEALVSNLIGSALSFGMASLVWKVIEKRLDKLDELERRVMKLEIKDEVEKEHEKILAK